MKLHHYPKIYNLGHKAIEELFLDEVIVEEKIDGSQFSFGIDADGILSCRSKGKELVLDAPEKMFAAAVEVIVAAKDKMIPGYIYRGEYLQAPKHNTLAYDRIPKSHIVIFDVERGEQNFIGPREKKALAKKIGLECVPLLTTGVFKSWEELKALLETESFLGGQLVEGLVIKNYNRMCPMTHEILMGKYVSEAFKEVHQGDWKERNPGQKEIIQRLIKSYRTPARWQKAVQHLKENGELEGSPRDIGKLIKEAQTDLKAECGDEIGEKLLIWALPKIQRGSIAGLPEWYKEQLAESQFGEK